MIREHRTIEASRKNLLGPGSKFGTILRNLGEEILQEGGDMYEATYFPSFDEAEESEEMPTMNMDGSVHVIGLCYDGLRRGLHMTILYREDLHELTVRWQGNLVFKECGGELMCYVPDREWEMSVDRLYEDAKAREETKKAAYDKEIDRVAKSRHKQFLDEMRQKWGLK